MLIFCSLEFIFAVLLPYFDNQNGSYCFSAAALVVPAAYLENTRNVFWEHSQRVWRVPAESFGGFLQRVSGPSQRVSGDPRGVFRGFP